MLHFLLCFFSHNFLGSVELANFYGPPCDIDPPPIADELHRHLWYLFTTICVAVEGVWTWLQLSLLFKPPLSFIGFFICSWRFSFLFYCLLICFQIWKLCYLVIRSSLNSLEFQIIWKYVEVLFTMNICNCLFSLPGLATISTCQLLRSLLERTTNSMMDRYAYNFVIHHYGI
jgi:hypothetical protein